MFDLECVGVEKRFGRLLAVDGVSLAIPAGSFFSILGPSGCGKTTLMRMIAGFEEPDGGDIRIKGRSVLGLPPNRRNARMVFQHLALFPMMNVGENIAYGLRCGGVPRDEIGRRVADVLARVGLPGVEAKGVHQLSGGQKQRIAIARCMVLEPDVLLLDEPLGALDLKLRERMKVELKLLQHQFRTTFVYITHDQSEALVMSDQVAVMNAGRFEQVGTPQDLYHRPATAFVAGFVGDANRWTGRVVGADGAAFRIETTGGLVLRGEAGGAPPDGTHPSGGSVVEVFVRPSAIMLRDMGDTSGAPDDNRIGGTVDSLLFNGADSRVLVRDPAGHPIEAALPAAGPGANFRPGAAVDLVWSPRHTIVFPAKAA